MSVPPNLPHLDQRAPERRPGLWPTATGQNPALPARHGSPAASPVLGYTKNSFAVLDRPNSHTHMAPDLLTEVIARLEPPALPFVKLRVDLGRVVGQSICVQTGTQDAIVYARRVNRQGPTRFVCDRRPVDCHSVIVILKATAMPKAFILISAFIGDHAEPEPWDRNATPAAWEFWRHHALIWGAEPVVPGSETSHCPW